MRVQEIFEVLTDMGLVRSQMEFSRIWLGKSPRYYSSLLARQQQPSVGTLTGLLFRLRNMLNHTNDGETRSAISSLIQRLDSHVAVRSITSTASSVHDRQPGAATSH
ncbi:DUF6626 family protein [Devosia sp.]|uniref:DUF6626 family protein n=1 Tax=Devosia sp. TaxID=1871048 RepID=UPI00345CD792